MTELLSGVHNTSMAFVESKRGPSPGTSSVSSGIGKASSGTRRVSSDTGRVSLGTRGVSSGIGRVTPGTGRVSRGVGSVSPAGIGGVLPGTLWGSLPTLIFLFGVAAATVVSGHGVVKVPELQMDQPVLVQPGPSYLDNNDHENKVKDYAARALEILTIRARFRKRKLRYRSRSFKAGTCEERYEKLSATHTMCLRDVGTAVRLSHAVQDAIVTQHNRYRSLVSPTAANMQVMVWDESLAEIAGKWSRQCRRGHDKKDSRPSPELPGVYIGQNAAYGYWNWQTAIEAWHNEVSDFKYGNGSLTGAIVGHYTQIVAWRSARVGCGQADCPESPYKRHFVCNYAEGQMNDDLKTPYRAGDRCADCPDKCDEDGNMCDCGGKVCLNGGNIDLKTCECRCLGVYTGDICDTLQCPAKDAWYCGTQWPKHYCKQFTNVRPECPYMCGVCSSEPSDKQTTPPPVKCRLQCKNGGKMHPSECACVCPEGFAGTRCEKKARLCEGKTCLNGGRLQTLSCQCDCSFGYTGKRCETKVEICEGKVCENRGRLNSTTCECHCPARYSGHLCQDRITDELLCPELLCQNGGVLQTDPCRCTCPEEFRGKRCEKPKCHQVTCHNGGQLNYNNCSCTCAGGFHGKRCKKKLDDTPGAAACDIACQNGGLLDPVACRCWCPSPFTGDVCQTVNCPREDHKSCENFPDTYCPKFFLMRHMCPYKCALCAQKDCAPDKWFCNENYIQPHLCRTVDRYCPTFCGLC